MAKNPSPFPFLLLKVSIFSFLLLFPLSSSAYHSSIPSSYTHHCSSTVQHCSPTEPELTTIPFPPNQDGYYIGGDGISNITTSSNASSSSSWYYDSGARKAFLIITNHVQKTECPEVYKVAADLILQTSGMSYYRDFTSFSYSYSPHVIVNGVKKGPLTFQMEGFWSPGSGKMCMVGFGDVVDGDMDDDHGRGRGRLSGILKMSNVTGSTELTSLVTGTLESDVGEAWSYEPVSMLLFPKINYEYKHARRDGKSCGGGGSGDVVLPPREESLSLPLSASICSPFFSSNYPLHLNYAKPCNVSSSPPAKSCSPLENHHEDEPDHRLPRSMSLRLLECPSDKQSLRFLMEFSHNNDIGYYHPFSPNTSLVSEGTWDAKNNRLCIVACRIRDATNTSFGASKVEDCSIRMSLRFPATWSMGNTSTMVGEIWSSLDAGDSAYFRPISVKDGGRYRSRGLPGLKYEYTMVEKANGSCSKVGKSSDGGKTKQFPNGRSDEMRFDMSFKDSLGRKKAGWGRAEPIFVGDQVPYWILGGGVTIVGSDSDRVPAKSGPPRKPVNISYSISYTPLNANSSGNGVWISAEGVYEAETGQLCMVGCKYASSSASIYDMSQELDEDSKDCEVSIKIEFPSTDSNDYIRGKIESTREKANDPRYFEPLAFEASSFSSRRARESVWRMDLEVIMALISNTLLCVFLCYQIFHVRRNPEVFPFLSILMLVVLALGHLIPLVLNFDELFSRKQERRGSSYYWRSYGGNLEVDEVILRVVTMIVLVLHLRLLQLTWLARQANKDKKASIRPAETKAHLVTFPLYIIGALIALGINWKHYEFGANHEGSHRSVSYHRSLSNNNNNQHSISSDLRSYAGLLLDGFLLPQILLNIFHGSIPQTPVLSRPFYIGITLARLAPHGYDLFRARNFADYFDWSYIYANPDGDYYSTWSDVIIPLVCLMFAVIIYLQQRFGGRCFLPKKLRRMEEMYQKVAVTDDEEQMEEKSHVVGHLPLV